MQLWAAPFSLATLKVTGESFPVADSTFVFGVSNTDTLVYLERSTALRQLTMRDRSGRKIGVIGSPSQDLRGPSLSPDGTRVAFAARDGMKINVWIAEVDRPVKTPLTFARDETAGFYDGPVWSPSGDRVAYFRGSPERWSILSRPADGSGAEVELVSNPVFFIVSQWHKPDQMIVNRLDTPTSRVQMEFISIPQPASERATPPKGNVLPYSEQSGRVSPDGKFVAFTSTQSGRSEVYVRPMNQNTGGKQVSEGGAGSPRWRRDGRELYYVEGNALMSVPVTASARGFGIGKPQVLFTVESGLSSGYDVWPDGQRFLIPEPVEGNRPPSIRVVQNWSAAFAPNRSKQ